jgi:tetratricopeptide (TPR) repeat protein
MLADSPLCFALIPFGSKADPSGGPTIDFDTIYKQAIQPAIEGAGMKPVRPRENCSAAAIHKPTFEQLLLCDFAVVDLTIRYPDVFYQLGARQAARPYATLAIFAANQKLTFDVGYLKAIPYQLSPSNDLTSREATLLQESLYSRLMELRKAAGSGQAKINPAFYLLEDRHAPDIKRLKTDVFRERVRYSDEYKQALLHARKNGDAAEIGKIEKSVGPLDDTEVGVLIDLLLSYRAVSAWEKVIDLCDRMPPYMRRSIMVREQYGLALNRLGRWQEAVNILEEVVAEHGPSSETFSILGRIYKDLYVKAEESGDAALAEDRVRKAIDYYVRGFEADWRDAYPGINALTLLDIQGTPDAEQKKAELLPIVMFAVQQRIKSSQPDYFDYATLLEIAVLKSAEEESRSRLSDALFRVHEKWEPKTTANNLSMISMARKRRGVNQSWLDAVISSLRS